MNPDILKAITEVTSIPNYSQEKISAILKFELLSGHMKTIRISAVSYYNTLPLIYGISKSGLLSNFELQLNVPSLCAEKLRTGDADISLVPVGALPSFPAYEVIGNHCIGAVGKVKTVLLLSKVPVQSLESIYLDTDSRTSVALVRILAHQFWNINPDFISLDSQDPLLLGNHQGVVLIGDKTFQARQHFPFVYDLAGCWQEMTGLPFVFAVWASVLPLPESFLNEFEAALQWGVNHIPDSIHIARNPMINETELTHYLTHDISFQLDEPKRRGMELFLRMLRG